MGCVLKSITMVVLLTAGTPSNAAEWKLAFEDNFDRKEPGELYQPSGRAKSLTIRDGRLLLIGQGAACLIDRPFTPDVRMTFDCFATEDMPPCDLSALLSTEYLLGFGARSNRANHLVGPGIRHVDLEPPFVIEQGKRYEMVAQREGNRITYQVNDTVIIDAASDNLMIGPSFDRVGFITWGGMSIDNVKVYERHPPHPDTPTIVTALPELPIERDGKEIKATADVSENARNGIAALNSKRFYEAMRAFEQEEDVVVRLAGLAHLYGDLDYIEKPCSGDLGSSVDFGELGAFAELWERQAVAHPENATLQTCLPIARHFGKLVLSRNGRHSAQTIVQLGPRNNPFYHKALLFRARYTYWDGMEGANTNVKNRALDMMRELQEIWPDNRVLREYLGPPVPWGEELNADVENHPAWAAYLREAYAREIAIMERLVDERQAPNGAFGGGWGDDVEMMRKWVPIAAISDCSTKIIEGARRLTDGIYTYQAPRAYDEGIGDVEHSAEPTADSGPTMLLLRHGDPHYIELNLASCRIIKDVMMGIDDNGFPRFKATEIGARGTNHEQIIGGGDTGYHARAMKHFYYLAWYGNEEARDWYLRWVDGWRHTCMIDEPTKAEGMLPGTIWYPSGSYEPPNGAPWYSEQARNYYGPTGLPIMLHQSFLAAYALTYDRRFLHPVQRMMDHATWGPYEYGEYEPGSWKWQFMNLVGCADPDVTSLYRMLTGERIYDEYTRRFGTPPQQYQIDQDVDRYLASFEQAAKSLRHNLWYYTTEVLSTDRLHLPAVDAVWGAYSGAISTLVDAETPTMGVTWKTPDANFAAIVTENTPTRLRAWIYTFWDEPTEIAMKLWRLTPGIYLATQGEQVKGEHTFQKRYGWGDPEPIEILHAGDMFHLTVPPKTVWVVDLRLHEEITLPPTACDLAIAARDLTPDANGLTVTVHNVGSAPAEDFVVALQTRDGDAWRTVAEQTVTRLSHPVDFVPFTVDVTFSLRPDQLASIRRVVVDPDDMLFELCETNNAVLRHEVVQRMQGVR